MHILIDLSALGAEVQRIAAAAVQRIVDAPDGQVRGTAEREIARLERGTPLEQTVARGIRVSISAGDREER